MFYLILEITSSVSNGFVVKLNMSSFARIARLLYCRMSTPPFTVNGWTKVTTTKL